MSVQIKTNWDAWIAAVEAGADASSAALAEQMLADSRDHIPDDGEHAFEQRNTEKFQKNLQSPK